MRILVIDDDDMLGRLLLRELGRLGYGVDVSPTATAGAALAEINDYDLMMVDWFLPDAAGLNLCQQLRDSNPSCVIMIISGERPARGVERSISAGADDFIAKPFRLSELKALIHARLRRRRPPARDVIEIGSLVLDQAARTASCRGQVVPLTPREFQLVAELAWRAGTVVERTELVSRVWDDNHDPSFHTLDVLMGRIRMKLRAAGAPAPVTLRGVGYQLGAGQTGRDDDTPVPRQQPSSISEASQRGRPPGPPWPARKRSHFAGQ